MSDDQIIKAAIVIVAYGNEKSIKRTLDAIAVEKQEHDKVVVVDNHPDHACASIAGQHKAVDHAIESENLGFGGGCNLGAEYAGSTDFLYFLNPDAVPQKDFLRELKRAYVEKPNWSAWMSLLLLPDGTVNSSGTAVHMSGLSWVLDYGSKRASFTEPIERAYISGACFAIRRTAWDKIGGFTSAYFLYYEDTELATRLSLGGLKMGLWPKSLVTHDYDFNNSDNKWFYLERNRYVYMTTSWPMPILLLLSPLLILCELGLWAVSLMQRRFIIRLRAVLSFSRFLPKVLAIRRSVQKERKISSEDFLVNLTADLQNPFLGRIGEIKLISGFFHLYKRATTWVLKFF